MMVRFGRSMSSQRASILSARWQAGTDQASALRPCAPVQARQQELTQTQRIAGDDALEELFARELSMARRVLAKDRYRATNGLGNGSNKSGLPPSRKRALAARHAYRP